MEFIAILRSTLPILLIVLQQTLDTYATAISRLYARSRTEFLQCVRDYRLIRALLLFTFLQDARKIISRVRHHVIDKQPAEAAVIRKSYTESFTMIAVAGAIVAQIAITAFSLPDVGSTHWTVQACFTASLVTGCLSVYYSCAVQLILAGLHGPDEMALWLTYNHLDRTSPDFERNPYAILIKTIPSFNSALILVAPAALLNWSLATFLVGLGIYLSLVLKKNLAEIAGTHASLAILITYITFTLGALIAFYVPLGLKVIETTISTDKNHILYQTALKYNQRYHGQDHSTGVELPGKERTDSQIYAGAPKAGATTDECAGVPGSANHVNDVSTVASALREAIRSERAHLAAQERLLLAFEAHAIATEERVKREPTHADIFPVQRVGADSMHESEQRAEPGVQG